MMILKFSREEFLMAAHYQQGGGDLMDILLMVLLIMVLIMVLLIMVLIIFHLITKAHQVLVIIFTKALQALVPHPPLMFLNAKSKSGQVDMVGDTIFRLKKQQQLQLLFL
jgi:hypothetical protein